MYGFYWPTLYSWASLVQIRVHDMYTNLHEWSPANAWQKALQRLAN